MAIDPDVQVLLDELRVEIDAIPTVNLQDIETRLTKIETALADIHTATTPN